MMELDQKYGEKFEEEVFNLTVNRLKIASILGVFLFFLFGIVDYVIAPEHFGRFMMMRTINSFVDLGIFFALRKAVFRPYTYLLVYIFYLLLSSFIGIM